MYDCKIVKILFSFTGNSTLIIIQNRLKIVLHYEIGFEFSLYLNQLLIPMLKLIIYRMDKVY